VSVRTYQQQAAIRSLAMRWIAMAAVLSCLGGLALTTEAASSESKLSVEQLLGKYSAARGGLDAWHKVQTMSWAGHIESENAAAAGASFTMNLKRPNMTRFEINGPTQKAVHIFDGTRGWKLRQTNSTSPELQDYTAEELSFARDALGLDGPLVDYKTKGVVVTLAGVEEIQGRKAYRLNLTLPSGATRRAWIDAHTFLEVRYDRDIDSAMGQSRTVSVYYRNYQPFEGLQIPLTIETGASSGVKLNKMVIDRVSINPPLADQLFAKPRIAKGNAVPLRSKIP
jgi:outer membrane lipoprotein-sorting protein